MNVNEVEECCTVTIEKLLKELGVYIKEEYIIAISNKIMYSTTTDEFDKAIEEIKAVIVEKTLGNIIRRSNN
jgi:hypothetical protein